MFSLTDLIKPTEIVVLHPKLTAPFGHWGKRVCFFHLDPRIIVHRARGQRLQQKQDIRSLTKLNPRPVGIFRRWPAHKRRHIDSLGMFPVPVTNYAFEAPRGGNPVFPVDQRDLPVHIRDLALIRVEPLQDQFQTRIGVEIPATGIDAAEVYPAFLA